MSRTTEYLDLDSLKPDPRNPKSHDLETIDSSVGRFGYIEPIVRDDRTGYIVSGHGRTKTLLAMKDRGESPPEGIDVTEDGAWLVPVTTGWKSRTDAEAAAALIALNRTTELGGWVDDALLDLLDDLEGEEGGLIGVGYQRDEIAALRERVAVLNDAQREEEEDERTPPGEDRGRLLSIADLSAGEPSRTVKHGDVWQVGHHVLVAVNPHREWSAYLDFLIDDAILAPYPDIYLPMSDRARERRMVLVQPDTFLAGHLMDKFARVFPDATVEKVGER